MSIAAGAMPSVNAECLATIFGSHLRKFASMYFNTSLHPRKLSNPCGIQLLSILKHNQPIANNQQVQLNEEELIEIKTENLMDFLYYHFIWILFENKGQNWGVFFYKVSIKTISPLNDSPCEPHGLSCIVHNNTLQYKKTIENLYTNPLNKKRLPSKVKYNW